MKEIKRIRPLGWMGIFIIAVLMSIGFNQMINKSEADEVVIVNSENWSKYPGINLQTQTKEAKTYTLSVSKPTTKSDKINQSIGEWLEQQEETFFDSMQEFEGILNEEFRAHLNIQVETEKVSENLYNLIFKAYIYSGGANGENINKSFTFELENDEILQLENVIHMNHENLPKELRRIIEDQLHSDEDLSIYLNKELLKEALSNPDSLEWSINQEVLTFYFDEYEIAAGAAGPIQIDIPMKNITPFINDEMAQKLEVTKENVEQNENKIREEDEEPIDLEKELDPEGKYVALTFDDGPNEKVTPIILEILNDFDAVATFFMLGSQVDYYPKLVKQVAENGHEIGNHTESHKDLTTLSPSEVRQELSISRDKLTEITGQAPNLIRPPYGAYDKNLVQIAHENQESIILWSVDSLDWQSRHPVTINETILESTIPGSIVLMHDIHQSTADALPILLSTLQKEGFEFITISQLLDLQNEQGVGPHYGEVNY